MGTIEIKNLTFSYSRPPRRRDVLKDINLCASGNEAIGIIGANGAGKSTLLKLLVGLQTEYDGDIFVNGLRVEKKNLVQIRKTAGYVFQDSDSQLFMNTVYDDVSFAPKNYGLNTDEVRKRTEDALKAVNIEHLTKRHIYRLSGGEKKLTAIAGILAMLPEVILMDEPSAALDPKNRRALIGILNDIDCLKVITSHDLDFVYDTCSRVILIADGVIIKDAPTEEILTDKTLLEENGLELPLSLSRK